MWDSGKSMFDEEKEKRNSAFGACIVFFHRHDVMQKGSNLLTICATSKTFIWKINTE